MKILDFGIAKLHIDQKQTATGVALGTPLYMAPEQWEARADMDGRVDIYALGMILYECLTGTYPFDAKNALQLMYAHTKKPVPDPGERVPLPDRLRRLVLGMVQKQPEDRPASMGLVEAELAQILAELGGAGVSAELSPIAAGPPRPMAATGDPVLSFTAEPSITGLGLSSSDGAGLAAAAAQAAARSAAAMAQSGAGPAAAAASGTGSAAVAQGGAGSAAAVSGTGSAAVAPGGAGSAAAASGTGSAAVTPGGAGSAAALAQSMAAPAVAKRPRPLIPMLLAIFAIAAVGAVAAMVLSLRQKPSPPRPGLGSAIAAPSSPSQAPRPSRLIELGPGRFLVGRPGLLQQPDGPAYPVEIGRFAIEAQEVSAAQLAEYVQAVHPVGMSLPANLETAGSLPAVQLTREQALGYCAWRYRGGRLPTEAEWEYAARDGRSDRFYPWTTPGTDPTLGRASSRANVGSPSPRLEPVDSRPQGSTPSGIFNMLGNAAEWTFSTSGPYPGSRANVPRGLAVVRGGNATSAALGLSATTRQFVAESRADPFIGFRCAVTR